jgi:hypothetical protein
VIEVVLFGLLIVAAVLAARCAPQARGCATIAGGAILAEWLLFVSVWAYAPTSPAWLASYVGIAVSYETTWAIADLAALIVVGVTCRAHWWSVLLWAPYLSMLAMIAVAWALGMEFVQYGHILNGARFIQILGFFIIGGGDCADYLSDRWRRLRGVVRRAAVHRRAASAMVPRR